MCYFTLVHYFIDTVSLIPPLHWHRKAGQHSTAWYSTDNFASVNKCQDVLNHAVPCWPDPLWSGGPAWRCSTRHFVQCKQKIVCHTVLKMHQILAAQFGRTNITMVYGNYKYFSWFNPHCTRRRPQLRQH